MKSRLSTDTLNLLWNRRLKSQQIFAKTDVHITTTHLDNTIQKEILNQYLPFPHTEQAVNRDVNYLLFQGGSYYEAG